MRNLLKQVWLSLVILASGFGLTVVASYLFIGSTETLLVQGLKAVPLGVSLVVIGSRINGKTWPDAWVVSACVAFAAVAALLVLPLLDRIDISKNMKVWRAAQATTFLVLVAGFYEAEVAGLRFIRRHREKRH